MKRMLERVVPVIRMPHFVAPLLNPIVSLYNCGDISVLPLKTLLKKYPSL